MTLCWLWCFWLERCRQTSLSIIHVKVKLQQSPNQSKNSKYTPLKSIVGMIWGVGTLPKVRDGCSASRCAVIAETRFLWVWWENADVHGSALRLLMFACFVLMFRVCGHLACGTFEQSENCLWPCCLSNFAAPIEVACWAVSLDQVTLCLLWWCCRNKRSFVPKLLNLPVTGQAVQGAAVCALSALLCEDLGIHLLACASHTWFWALCYLMHLVLLLLNLFPAFGCLF